MGSNGSNGHSKSLVFVQLTGGNDALNTVLPINDEHYYNFRPAVQFQPEDLLELDGNLGLNPNMTAMKRLWDEGKSWMKLKSRKSDVCLGQPPIARLA